MAFPRLIFLSLKKTLQTKRTGRSLYFLNNTYFSIYTKCVLIKYVTDLLAKRKLCIRLFHLLYRHNNVSGWRQENLKCTWSKISTNNTVFIFPKGNFRISVCYIRLSHPCVTYDSYRSTLITCSARLLEACESTVIFYLQLFCVRVCGSVGCMCVFCQYVFQANKYVLSYATERPSIDVKF